MKHYKLKREEMTALGLRRVPALKNLFKNQYGDFAQGRKQVRTGFGHRDGS